jgi:hypothetical protein
MAEFERLPVGAFAFTSGGLRDLYFAVLHVCNAANERLETALVVDDVQQRWPTSGSSNPSMRRRSRRPYGIS